MANIGRGLSTLSLDVDASDRPHLSFQSEPAANSYGLGYARWDGAQWLIEEIVSGQPDSNNGGYSRLRLDSQGEPHVLYATATVLSYAGRTASGWVSETVAAERPASLVGLDIDPADVPHAVAVFGSELRLYRRLASGWAHETIGSGMIEGPDIALDHQGAAHVVYSRRSPSQAIIYARRGSSGWVLTELAAGSSARIAVGPDGRPQVVYSNGRGTSSHTRFDGAQWVTQQLATSSNGIAIGVSSSGSPAIAHNTRAAMATLTFHIGESTGWRSEQIHASGLWPSEVVFDGNGTPWVAFFDTTTNDIRVAHQE